MFLSRKNTYIVPTIHELSATNFSYTENTTQFIPLEIRNPVRYIVFVLQRKDNVDDRIILILLQIMKSKRLLQQYLIFLITKTIY